MSGTDEAPYHANKFLISLMKEIYIVLGMIQTTPQNSPQLHPTPDILHYHKLLVQPRTASSGQKKREKEKKKEEKEKRMKEEKIKI